MPYLYVANTTQHNQNVYYRLDFNTEGLIDVAARMRAAPYHGIPSGRQVTLGNTDFHLSQIDEIIEQLSKVGGMDAKDVHRTKAFIPYVYSIGSPVSPLTLNYVRDHNRGVKLVEGNNRRAQAAVAANEALSQQVEEVPRLFEVEIEQVDDDVARETRLEAGYRVKEGANNPAPSKPPRAPRKSARAAA